MEEITEKTRPTMIPTLAKSLKQWNLSGSKGEGTQVSHLDEFAAEVVPTPHGVQATAPADGAKKSGGQAVHKD
jgi:hypothetical protein